ncbi:hypothetical protein GUITHDRAFT_104224 [Guillardia theta CCMP2712]|uniref:Uncharacterized protein n=1 Tax=Guillardia theta (strain CCMP2712) TaxID=905079 RepID=L1JNJ4_GUITC|nr:hypothetical protein GUITHDRAFT_104224 [Guillardia theta CCMP2712]EKX49829.1 hypothetical protein GUITHDRAFT_104224 [Guillardia theta CCMP2712]|eukprot:XP_005836809.1 hypothetical protein GUITHDRAFT_104224 [Guillardia theta CCMP2712]
MERKIDDLGRRMEHMQDGMDKLLRVFGGDRMGREGSEQGKKAENSNGTEVGKQENGSEEKVRLRPQPEDVKMSWSPARKQLRYEVGADFASVKETSEVLEAKKLIASEEDDEEEEEEEREEEDDDEPMDVDTPQTGNGRRMVMRVNGMKTSGVICCSRRV